MLDAALIEAVREAAETHRVPGGVHWRILRPDSIGAIAASLAVERRAVELAALDSEIVPVHYMRNIARFAIRGQMTLLSGSAAVVAAGPAAVKCLEMLALAGVGELRVLVPGGMEPAHGPHLAARARNRNASLNLTEGVLELRQGDPAGPLRGAAVVAGCLESAMDESLLQAACRRLQVPFVCAGVQDSRAQATTIFPGDAGVGLIYRSDHPHLDRERPESSFAPTKAPQVAGAWMAEQCLHVLLEEGDLLRNRLLYANLYEGEMEVYPLG